MADEKSPSKFAPAGVSGLEHYAGYIDEEWLKDLKGDKAIKVFREMADNHAVVGGILLLINTLAKAVDYTPEPSDKARASSAAAAEFVQSCYKDLDRSWADTLNEMLTAIIYGHAYLEITYRIRNRLLGSLYDDNMIGWRSVALRAQSSLDHWQINDDGKTVGMWQRAAPDYRLRYIPADKALHLRFAVTKDNPEGRSILRGAYRPYYLSTKIEDLEAVGVERDLVGLPVIELPEELMLATTGTAEATTRASYFKLGRSLRRNSCDCALMPSELDREGNPTGYKLRLLTGNSSRAIPTAAIIDRYDNRIATSMLASFVLLGQQQHGSFALSSNQTDVFGLALGGILDWLCEEVTRQMHAPLCLLNGFAPEDVPYLKHGDIETRSITEVADYVTKLIGSGALTPSPALERALRDLGSLPQDAAESDTIG